MILEDVDFADSYENDVKSPDYFRNKIMRITTDIGTFETPDRMNTRSEYLARSGMGLLKVLPRELAIDFKLLDQEHVEHLMNDDKKAAKMVALTKQFNDITRRAVFRLSIFQPSVAALDDMDIKRKIEFADTQARSLQIALGTNLITFPYLKLPLSDYINFIDTHYRRDEEFSTIFTLDLGMDPSYLEKILHHLAAKEEPIIIPVIYKHPDHSIPQRRIIASYFNNKRIAFLACQVPRENFDIHASNLHQVAFREGFDLVALLQPAPSHPDEDEERDLNKIKIFDPSTLGIDSIHNVLAIPSRNIIDELKLPSYDLQDLSYLNRALRGYRGALNSDRKFQYLYYLARSHEGITSPPMFGIARERIEKGEMAEYIRGTKLSTIPMIDRRF